MSDPVTGTTIAAGGLMGASLFGLATGIDYGVVFGAFAGAVFYVATAVNISRLKLVGYFITSFIFGVLGAPLVGSFFSRWTNYSDRPLDALGAVMVAAVAIKLLTFVNNQDLGSLFGILSRYSLSYSPVCWAAFVVRVINVSPFFAEDGIKDFVFVHGIASEHQLVAPRFPEPRERQRRSGR